MRTIEGISCREAGTVHPEEKESLYKDMRIHQMELTGNHVDPFVPLLNTIDQSTDKRPGAIAHTTAECASIHTAATHIMEYEEWDFLGVYYDGIDHYCHGFMKYHPPHRPHILKKDFDLYKDVVNGACRFHDMMLGRLLELAGDDTNVLLISDHGFHPDHNRPIKVPKEPMGPAHEHSPYGIIVMKGPDIKKDEIIHGASLLDVTPTILQLYDLPVGEDMDGKVLRNAFKVEPDVRFVDSWENIKGEDGSHPTGYEIHQEDSEKELQQLIDLGYIEDYGEDYEKAIKNTLAENKFTLAKAYIDGNKWDEGIELLEELIEDFPDKLHYASRLIHAYQVTQQMIKARELTDEVKKIFPHRGSQLDLLEASLLFTENKPKAALKQFLKVKEEAGDFYQINLRIAHAFLSMNEHKKALEAVEDELVLDPESEKAYFAKGKILYQLCSYDKALESFLSSVGLDYHNPAAHFMIGQCLSELEKYEEAINAYEVCLKFGPAFNKARERIVNILFSKLNQPGRAKRYQSDFDEQLQGTIYVVSGLPRSGTSLMMQMMDAGGLEVFTDNVREADENNPKGYYEHEAVKKLAKNNAFLEKAKDKTVKVIAHLLPHLPSRFRYKIIFMNRDLTDVLNSQQNMLIRDGKRIKEDVLPLNLYSKYEETVKKTMNWAQHQRNVEILNLKYEEVLDNPFEQSLIINEFFEGILKPEKMALVPDAKLYRERTIKTLKV